MKKFLILIALLVLGFVSCGCISSQPPIIAENSSLITTTTVPTLSPGAVHSNPVTTSPTQSPGLVSYENGVSLYNQKKYQEAIDAFNTTISLNATNGDAYLARGKAFYQIGRKKIYEVRGDEEFDQAINDFTKALLYGGNKSEILTFRGWSYYWKGETVGWRHIDGNFAKASFPLFELAIADFTQILTDNPDNVDALNGRSLGNANIGAGTNFLEYQSDSQKFELGKIDAQRANNLDPNNSWSHYALYRLAWYEKQPYEIYSKELDKAILDNPGEAWFYMLRGGAKRLMKDYEGALNDENKAVELQPRCSYAYDEISGIYFDQEKYEDSLVSSQKTLEINPNIGRNWEDFALGQSNYLYLHTITSDGLDECIKSIDRAIAMDPEAASYHYYRFQFLVAANRYDEAAAEARTYKSLALTNDMKVSADLMETVSNFRLYNPYLKRY